MGSPSPPSIFELVNTYLTLSLVYIAIAALTITVANDINSIMYRKWPIPIDISGSDLFLNLNSFRIEDIVMRLQK